MKNRKTNIDVKYGDDPKEYKRLYYLENKDRNAEKVKLYKDTHKKEKSESDKKWRMNNKDKKKKLDRMYFLKYRETIKYKFSTYKNGAKQRGHTMELTEDDFKEITSRPCNYCGHNVVGVDRVNNKIGYRLDNVVPCCKMCNRMKHAYNKDEFINQCIKISKYNGTK